MKATRLLVAFLIVLSAAVAGCSRDASTHGDTTSSSGNNGGGSSGGSGGY